MNFPNYNKNASNDPNILRTYNNIILDILYDPAMEKYFLQNLTKGQLQQLRTDDCKQKIFLSIVNTILLSRKDILEIGYVSHPLSKKSIISKNSISKKKSIKKIRKQKAGSRNHYGRSPSNPNYGVAGPRGIAARLRSWGSILSEEPGVDPYLVFTRNITRDGRRLRRRTAHTQPYPEFLTREDIYLRDRREAQELGIIGEGLVILVMSAIIIGTGYLSALW